MRHAVGTWHWALALLLGLSSGCGLAPGGASVGAIAPSSLEAAQARGLSQATIARMDRVVNPLGDLKAGREREAFYAGLYQNPALQTQADQMLTKWVMGGADQTAIREAYLNLTARKGRPATPTEAVVQHLLATRRERWQRLAARFGTTAPDTFRLHRGVRGEYALEELVTALETPGRKTVRLSHHSVASWTTDLKQARRFADAPAASVIYRADIPLEQTLADKWVDGSGFLVWCPDQQEVMVAARNLEVPLAHIEATFRGQVYTAAERQQLVRDWRAAHPRAKTS